MLPVCDCWPSISRHQRQAGRKPPDAFNRRESPVPNSGAWEGASGVPSTHLGVDPDVSPVEQWRGPLSF